MNYQKKNKLFDNDLLRRIIYFSLDNVMPYPIGSGSSSRSGLVAIFVFMTVYDRSVGPNKQFQ